MSYNTYDVDFSKAKVGVDGVLYKAGWTTTDDTLEGLGRGYDGNSWVTPNGATIVNGGLRATVANKIDLTMADAAGRYSAIRSAYMARGALQIKIHLADLYAIGASLGIVIQSTPVSGGIGSPVIVRVQTSALATDRYNQLVSDYDGNEALTNPCFDQAGSQVYDAVDAYTVFHAGLADGAGYVNYGIDWVGNVQRIFLNGYLVNIRFIDTYDTEFNLIDFQRSPTQVSMKELVMINRPFTRSRAVECRIAMVGHSYVDRQALNRKSFDNGIAGGYPGLIYEYGTVDSLNPSILKNLNIEAEIFSTGYSAQAIAYQESRIINGTATAFTTGTGNDQDQVKRHRPHFCVMFGSVINDGATASLTLRTSIHDISVNLMSEGIIPVWCVEWDNIALSATTAQGYVESEVARQQAINDMGIIYGSVKFGADPDHSLSSYEVSTGRHPNLKGQALWGEYIADEINRLILNPPNYSRLAGGDGQYMAIAAPS